jgi:hypothetical protein
MSFWIVETQRQELDMASGPVELNLGKIRAPAQTFRVLTEPFSSIRSDEPVNLGDLVERFVAVRQSIDLCPSQSTQAVLSEFFQKGHFARHIRKMRQLYSERRRVLVDEVTVNSVRFVTLWAEKPAYT